MKLRKICKYDEKHWLMQDLNKNLILFNEDTHMLHDLQMFIQPDSSKREDSWKDRSLTNSQYEEFMRETNQYMRCGTRNSQETD